MPSSPRRFVRGEILTQATLTPIRFENAVWEGHIAADRQPQVVVRYLGEPLPDVELAASGDGWALRVPVPDAVLSEGVHTVVIWDEETQLKLGDFTVIAGSPAGDDLRSELELLRAELDMLKRAFRRSQAENT